MSDLYDLDRFVQAQSPVYEQVRAELARGKKTSHWMWFIFPQIAGLGRSPMATRFAIGSLNEAKAYLAHALLGPRLNECTHLVLQMQGRLLHEIFGSPDDIKFRSSMTLFAQAVSTPSLFDEAIEKYCGAEPDPITTRLLDKPR
jgi:uncharacterized protein (DUF1810 family)